MDGQMDGWMDGRGDNVLQLTANALTSAEGRGLQCVSMRNVHA